MRLILRRIVGQLGFEVFEAEDGRAALDTLPGSIQCPIWCWSIGTCRT